jgi:hypothetical protein
MPRDLKEALIDASQSVSIKFADLQGGHAAFGDRAEEARALFTAQSSAKSATSSQPG